MPLTPLDKITNKYQRRQAALIAQIIADIVLLYDELASTAAFLFAKRRLLLSGALPPDVLAVLNTLTKNANDKVYAKLTEAIKTSWLRTNSKHDEIEKLYDKGKKAKQGNKAPAGPKKPKPRTKNSGPYSSVDAYIDRTEYGKKLSGRVWKMSQHHKRVITRKLKLSLKDGTSAANLARDLKFSLHQENNALPAPGKGVYRNPRLNAERLTRTEINMAQNYADHDRWQGQWFITGIEVALSVNHPMIDICDDMKGIYPKTFVFTGWHPQCRCISKPVMASQKVRDQMLEYQLGARDKAPTVSYVEKIPKAADEYLKENAARISKWKNQPYWRHNNPELLGQHFKKK